MAFRAYEFTFRGLSCRQFDLLMYDSEDFLQENPVRASAGEPQIETVFRRTSALLRGVERSGTLTFPLSFGLCPERIYEGRFLDRFELERISSWLTGYSEWNFLTICQPDLAHVRYRCIIKDLTDVSFGRETYGFTCTVVCDSPYAYLLPKEYRYVCDGTRIIPFFNRSSMNAPYSPVLSLRTKGSAGISIFNETTGEQGPAFGSAAQYNGAFRQPLPASDLSVTLHNDSGVLSCSDSRNLYPYFNFEFLHLQRGENRLRVDGACELALLCEFPVDVGG